MGREQYQPANNYERNFMMVKRFGGKFSVLMLPILFFISIVCSCYLNVVNEPHIEVIIVRVITSKLNFNMNLGGFETVFLLGKILLFGLCTYAILYIFFKSKNTSFQATPDLGYLMLYNLSIAELLTSALGFVTMFIMTISFIFGKPEKFESIGAVFFMTVADLKAYKISIIIIMILLDILLFLMIWLSQSQADFMKSVRLSLVESVPKNKGAYTYGVFSMSVSVVLIGIAAFITFMYYCYQDAFSGLGITMDKTYVYVSLVLAYVKGLIPFFLAICSFSYSAMVDQLNTMGAYMYNQYDVMGEAQDPNMYRNKGY